MFKKKRETKKAEIKHYKNMLNFVFFVAIEWSSSHLHT